MRYIPNDWHDHIVDPITGDIVQQGTRFTAARANNIEQALVYLMNVRSPHIDQELSRIYLELEMLGRSPENNGTFFDTMDGATPKLMIRDESKAVLQVATNSGATTLVLDSVPFSVGEVVTIADEEQVESVTISAIDGNNVTVSPTTKDFKKGAFVTRSNAVINAENRQMIFGNWFTYSVEVV